MRECFNLLARVRCFVDQCTSTPPADDEVRLDTPVAPVIPTISRFVNLIECYHRAVFKRQTTGSVLCTSCGVLVGVNDDRCYNCGRRNPGLWGFSPVLRSLGRDMGFVPFVIGACAILYVLTLLASRGDIGMGSALSF